LKKILILATILIVLVVSCVREIDFLVKTEGTDTLVVDGNFTDQTGPHRLFLTRPNTYAVNSFENVTNATVIIKDDQGNQAAYEVAGEIGFPYFYQLPSGAMQGVAGRKYHLEIKLADGKTYLTTPQMMPNRIELDSVTVFGRTENRVSTVDVVVEEKRCVINADFKVPSDANNYYMRWEAAGVYVFFELVQPGPLPPPALTCYLTDEFNKQFLPIQSVKGKNGKALKIEIGSKILDKSFNFVQYITVVQRSLNRESFDYWESIKKVSDPAGTIFDAPPGAVRGNVYPVNASNETPLGFFEVAAVDTLRRRINNNDLGFDYLTTRHCVDPFYIQEPPYVVNPLPECYNCLILPKSTLTKPWYWQ
jgi:Domain of unknown function (DUF4249)